MKIDILTLFPEMFPAVLSAGVVGRAAERGLLTFSVTDIREHTTDRHRSVDDYPFGGGAGQLLAAQPIFAALQAIGPAAAEAAGGLPPPCRLIYLSPRGRVLDHGLARELAGEERLVLLCGHYEGVDQRVLDAFPFEEVSIGDYVLTGGEIPAMALIDAVCRLVPGVLGSEDSHREESVYSGLLEYPQYTRPASYEGLDVPEVLLSGNHREIELWNFEQALRLTAARRPEMLRSWAAAHLSTLDKKKKALAEAVLREL
ncbi:MAG: tRNA (guanosine(37)-N1)-methyltransferase TrmD [Clostridiales Family XIII bacterium]|jgi:tRNA (guanine37-N1)-methyltransferase|nr:tRNA (guanosine(37)-N1)-methyltransferase TrmD [Clostridiales Family XIII bacterium]